MAEMSREEVLDGLRSLGRLAHDFTDDEFKALREAIALLSQQEEEKQNGETVSIPRKVVEAFLCAEVEVERLRGGDDWRAKGTALRKYDDTLRALCNELRRALKQ